MLGTRDQSPEETPWGCLSGVAEPPQVSIDPNGNLASKTEGTDNWTYEWNARNELTRVTKNSLEQARFAYDPMGRRVERVAGGVTTAYTYDRAAIVREIRGSTTLKYVHGPGTDEPLAVEDGTALAYYLADGLGSVVKTTNAAGAVTLTRQYDAWGNLETGGHEPGYSYTGREWDVETGLYYYRARYYDPRLGRFTTEDPAGFEGGTNFYAYVRDNPVNMTDPSGLMPGLCSGKEVAYCQQSCAARGEIYLSCFPNPLNLGFFDWLPPSCTCVGGSKRDFRWQRCLECYNKCKRAMASEAPPATNDNTCPVPQDDLCRKAYERCIRSLDPVIFPPGFACK